ncbi:MAG: DUF3592 domain-containing protein [Microcoleaceae cyanobacterium]
MKHTFKLIFLISLIISIFPASCSVGGGYWYYKTKSWVDSAKRIDGKVKELLEVESETNGIMYRPVVQYKYEGEIKTYTPNVYSYPKPYNEGDTVTILIDRKNPEKVRIDSVIDLYFGVIMLGIFTLPFVVIVLIAVSVSYVLMRFSREVKNGSQQELLDTTQD